MNTIELAVHTAQIEGYDDMDFVNARNQALARRYEAWMREQSLKAEIITLQAALYEAKHQYADADRACNLFENAQFDLNQQEESAREFVGNA